MGHSWNSKLAGAASLNKVGFGLKGEGREGTIHSENQGKSFPGRRHSLTARVVALRRCGADAECGGSNHWGGGRSQIIDVLASPGSELGSHSKGTEGFEQARDMVRCTFLQGHSLPGGKMTVEVFVWS